MIIIIVISQSKLLQHAGS